MSSTAPSPRPSCTILPPPERLELGPDLEAHATRLDLSSLLLAGLSGDERDPIAGVLHDVAADLQMLSYVLDLRAGQALRRIENRVRIALELHRRSQIAQEEPTVDLHVRDLPDLGEAIHVPHH